MRVFCTLLSAAACALAACAHRPLGPDGKPLWVEVRSPNFVVRAATGEAEARRATLQLERIRAGLLASSWHAKENPLDVVQVLILEDRRELRGRFRFPEGIEGAAYMAASDQLRLLATADQDPDEVPVLKHELAHALNHGFLLREPLWLGEGLACYLETLKLTDTAVTVGKANLERQADAVQVRIPFAQVMTAGPELYDQRDDQLLSGFYGRAWLLVHLLANRHRAGFEAFMDRLARAEEPAAAFAAALPGLTPARIEEEVAEYLKGGAYQMLRVELPAAPVALAVRTLSAGEAARAEAEVWQMSARMRPFLRQEAIAAAKAALAAAPADPATIETWLELAEPGAEERTAAARRAAQAHPDDALAWLLLADALDKEGGPDYERAVLEANRLAPTGVRALQALARLQLSQQRFPEAMATAKAAHKRRPGAPNPLDLLATTYAANGMCAEAVRTEQRVLEVLPDRAPPEVAAQVRARIVDLGKRCAEVRRSRLPPVEPRLLGCSGKPLAVQVKGKARPAPVHVRFRVLSDGTLADLAADAGTPPAIAKAAIAYVGSCRFAPATQGGVPIEARMDQTFAFGN